jgi:pimeloyl-ACP methyl ester carboxylesterase
LPDVDWTDPAAQAQVRAVVAPMTLLRELRQTRRAYQAARQLRTPALVVQGMGDTVSRPANTRRLAGRLAGPIEYQEIDGGHDLIEPASAAWPEVARRIVAFAEGHMRPIAR